MLYADILTSGEPDAVYEFFWLMFKDSVKNFSSSVYGCTQLTEISGEVPVISGRLNNLQKDKKYNDIISEIDEFLTKFAWTSLLTVDDPCFSYHINILNTNINRWINLPGIKETPQSAALHVILALSKNSSQYDLVKYARGPPESPFDVKKVVSRITKFSLRKDRPTALTRLTGHPVLQPLVVDVLQDIGIDAPVTIRDGQKIIKFFNDIYVENVF
jgi:hypothetical protein